MPIRKPDYYRAEEREHSMMQAQTAAEITAIIDCDYRGAEYGGKKIVKATQYGTSPTHPTKLNRRQTTEETP